MARASPMPALDGKKPYRCWRDLRKPCGHGALSTKWKISRLAAVAAVCERRRCRELPDRPAVREAQARQRAALSNRPPLQYREFLPYDVARTYLLNQSIVRCHAILAEASS